MPNAQPNLLFLMTDHQRADSLSMVQAGAEVCPNLNRLAARSAVFTRAYNTCPLCVPARTALATGKYPTHNGVVFNDLKGVRAGDHTPIHQLLAEAGYQVAHAGVHHISLKPTLQDRVDFTEWVSRPEYGAYLKAQNLDEDMYSRAEGFRSAVMQLQDGERVRKEYSNAHTGVWPHAARHFQDLFYAERAAEFLCRPPREPFALFVYLWAPHPPLRVPEPYASLFDPERIDLPDNVGHPAQGEPANRRLGMPAQLAEGLDEQDWRRAWAAHLGLVRLADDALGQVLDAFASYMDRSIVLFTVDHGDQLGQHRMYQKMEMYEPAIRVPLVIRVPGADAATWDTPVSHLDVVPTLVDATGIAQPQDLDGTSLWPALSTGAAPPERPVFSQYSGNPTLGDTRRAAITRQHKYVHDPADEPELYDLQADPLEMTNLARDPTHAQTAANLHAVCKTWHQAHGDWLAY